MILHGSRYYSARILASSRVLLSVLFGKKLYDNNRVVTGFPDTGHSSTISIHFHLLRWGSAWSVPIFDSEIMTRVDMSSRFVYVCVAASLSGHGHRCILSLAPKTINTFDIQLA